MGQTFGEQHLKQLEFGGGKSAQNFYTIAQETFANDLKAQLS